MLLGAAIYFGYGYRRNRLARREAGREAGVPGVVPGRGPAEQLGRG
jgi:hypothetical protein